MNLLFVARIPLVPRGEKFTCTGRSVLRRRAVTLARDGALAEDIILLELSWVNSLTVLKWSAFLSTLDSAHW